MTSKIHLNKLIQISNNEEAALANINANVDILNDVIDDYVSRSAKVPTQMQAPLDMGSQKIINVGTPTDDNDVVRYKDVKDALATIEQVQIDIQDVDNAVIRANNAATSANQSAVDAYNSKETAVAAKDLAVAADEHITELLTEDYPEITTVANNISDVSTVAGNISDVNAVADVSSDVSTVAGMSSDIADVVANMTDIQNASQNAQDAAASATAAQQWATKMDGPVSGSDYSSEYYAAQAAQSATTAADIVASIGTVMRYKGSVATYADLPSTGNTVGDVYNVTDTGINYAWTTENTWDDFGGAVTVSLVACTDVDLSSPTNGQVLSYNATTQKWENADVSGGTSSLEDIAVASEGVKFITAPFINATVVGSPTISSSYVASGFSDSDYLTHSNLLNNVTDSFEIVVPFYTNTTSTNNFGLIDSLTPCNVRLTLTSDAKVRLRISTDGTTNYAIDMTGTTTLTMHAKYWVKVFYERSIGYRLLLSTNGSDWNLENHTVTTTKPYSSGNILKIGDNAATGYSLDGGIYLAGTYIQVDDKIWNAVEETRTGIATTSNIQVDQTYDSTSANAQSGVAIDGAGFLRNTATAGISALTLLGTAGTKIGSINIGESSSVSGSNAVSIGYGSKSNLQAVSLGYYADASKNYDIAIGTYTKTTSDHAIAIGIGTSVYNTCYAGQYAVAIGNESGSSANGVAVGNSAYGADHSVAVGDSANNTANSYSVAIGSSAKNTAGNSTAIGASTQVSASYATALGYNAKASASYAIQLGYGTNSTANTLSVGLSTSNNYELLSSDGTIPFARQAKAIIEGASDPDTATVGTVGLLYRNTTDGGIFKCTDITGGVYTWEELGAGGGGSVDLDDIAVAGSGVTLQRPAIGFDVVGSPTISPAGVASGFSDSNYLTCQNIINSASQSFEFVTAIELNTTSSIDGCAIIDTYSSQSIRLTLTSDAKIRLRVTADGTSTYPVDITSTTALTTNTKYWIKITYSSTEGYDLYTSTNGTSWTQEAHSVELTRPYYGGGVIKFGDNNAIGYSLDGSIYLADTSINVNGSILWEAYNPDKTSISAAASVVDQTYDASSTNAVSGVAIANSRILQNSSTASHALTLLGTATTQANSVNIGYSSQASSGGYSVAIGSSAVTRGNGVSIGKEAQQSSGCSFGVALGSESKVGAFVCGTSLGAKASVQAHGSIQIGQGTNSEAQTLYVGFSNSSGTATNNYKMLDSSGIIPAARLGTLPAADGTYIPMLTITGGVPTISWVAYTP